MNTTINNRIECNEPHANLDSYYGPYDSVEKALEALKDEVINGVTYTKRHVGLTVGIGVESIVEYWFDGGTEDDNLNKKTADAGLPGGVKIVTFNKNGGSGVQASLLTDNDGYVVMPAPSITRSEYNFTGWNFGNDTHKAGDEVHVNDNANFVAQWEKIKYTVSWNNKRNITITGTCDGNNINSGESCNSGSRIILTATPNTGYQFNTWDSIPSGATQTGNILEFTLTGNVSGITATATAIVTKFLVGCYYDSEQVTEVEGIYTKDGQSEPIIQFPCHLEGGVQIKLTPHFNSEKRYKYGEWSGLNEYDVHEYSIEEESGILTINSLRSPLRLTVIGTNE